MRHFKKLKSIFLFEGWIFHTELYGRTGEHEVYSRTRSSLSLLTVDGGAKKLTVLMVEPLIRTLEPFHVHFCLPLSLFGILGVFLEK